MGVSSLWQIFDQNGIDDLQPLTCLRGKTVAVDLSTWIVQAQALNKCKKPHLKLVFQRVSYLLTHEVLPVIVTDGKPPELKGKNREKLDEDTKECEKLLNTLGIVCLKSKGEAESLCAFLNMSQIVDGVITEDSDVFLYGAETVYRDFNVSGDTNVKVYTMKNIEDKLSVNREKLVALALLLGSDYDKGGIPGIGPETALNMFEELGNIDILQRFKDWKIKSESELFPNFNFILSRKKNSHCLQCGHEGTETQHKKIGCEICGEATNCLPKVDGDVCHCTWHKNLEIYKNIKNEYKIYGKAKHESMFPDQRIIDEFLNYTEELPDKESLNWRCPDFVKFQIVTFDSMGWSSANCEEKVLPLVTSWQIAQIRKNKSADTEDFIYKPIRIEKQQIKNGLKYFKVLWSNKEFVSDSDLSTLEAADVFTKAYPVVVKVYEDSIEEKKEARKKKSGTKRLASPSKSKGNTPDLVNNAKIQDFFSSSSSESRKRSIENSSEINGKIQCLEKELN